MTDSAKGSRVSLDVVKQLVALGREQGVPVDALIADHDICIEPLPDAPAYMCAGEVERLLGIALKTLDEPLPGLMVSRGPMVSFFGLAGFVAQTASTVREFLEQIVQVEPLLGDAGATGLHYRPGEVELTWACGFKDPQVHYHVVDFIICGLAWFLLAASRPGTRMVRAIHLQHGAPRDPALTHRYGDMFSCPVYFDQPENAIVLLASALEVPMPGADPQLHEVLVLHARKLLDERSRTGSFTDLARTRLHQLLLNGNPSREKLAATLNMTSRTLHRKLREEHTSYRALLDYLRLERACTSLRDHSQIIQQVAAGAGFDEAHSFTRWFRTRM
ncbi:MAG: AraC family transcriptional regulator ligand-binding domain-containing protein, partial [Alcanivorax sp.]|nr:AraC family transcriptional regulator ligand-binding domain-containing protein [Alcanivorax sp.]